MRATSFVIAMLCWTSAALGDEPEPPPIDPCEDGLTLCDNPAAILRACWSGRTVCVGERVWEPAGGLDGFLPGYTAGVDDALEPYIHNLQVVSVSPVFITQKGLTNVTVNWKVLCSYQNGQPVYDYLTTTFKVEAVHYVRAGSTSTMPPIIARDERSLNTIVEPDEETNDLNPVVASGVVGGTYVKHDSDLCTVKVRGEVEVEDEWSISASAQHIGSGSSATSAGLAWSSLQNAVIVDKQVGATTIEDANGFSFSIGPVEIPYNVFSTGSGSASDADQAVKPFTVVGQLEEHTAGTNHESMLGAHVQGQGEMQIVGMGTADVSVVNELRVKSVTFHWPQIP